MRYLRIPPVWIALLALAGLGASLWAYTGPRRTETVEVVSCKWELQECQYIESKDKYSYHKINDWSCQSESKPWKQYSERGPNCNEGHLGARKVEKSEKVTGTTTLQHPPAVVDGALTCALAGENNWCRAGASLQLSGSEPLSGYSIYALEGTQNGGAIACMAASCAVPLVEGRNDFTYWALSTYGDSSLKGSTSGWLDSAAPELTTTLTGSPGQNGWYLSPVSFEASASDLTSGLAALTCDLDGTAQPTCAGLLISAEGTHSLAASARDVAGNENTVTRSLSIDTQPPSLTAGLSGTAGANSWYTSATLNASAADPAPGSGLAALQVSLDDGVWSDFPGSFDVPDGIHTLETRALDVAGWEARAARVSAKVDSVPPELDLVSSGTPGLGGWYVSPATLSASASDATSGLAVFEVRLDGGDWVPYSAALTLPDGTHRADFWAEDAAGHVTRQTEIVRVDTRPPVLNGSLSGTPGADGWYVSNVTVTAGATDPAPGSGVADLTYVLDGAAPAAYLAPLVLTEGWHSLMLTAADAAGQVANQTQTLRIDTTPPAVQVTTLPTSWIKDTLILEGTASDAVSGLAKVDISTDNKTWQAVTGTANWTYTWNTRTGPNGAVVVRVRATDTAGLATTASFTARVDNAGPVIELPESWFVWETVRLDVNDSGSGVDEIRLVIRDPENRWPRRRIDVRPGHLPLDFKWDRRFGDGTLAPWGTYDVIVTAIDRLGHVTEKQAAIRIVLDVILPPPPTATALSTPRPATVTPTTTALATDPPTPTPTAGNVVSVWGTPQSPSEATPTGEPPVVEPVETRATPTTTTFTEWIETLLLPPDPPAATTDERIAPGQSAPAPALPNTTPLLVGAAAVGALGAYLNEKKRKEEDAAHEPERKRPSAAVRERQLEKQLGKAEYQAQKKAGKLKKDIANVVAEEDRKWQQEHKAKIAQEQGFQELKGVQQQQYVRQRLEEIKQGEAAWREEKKKEAAEAQAAAAAAAARAADDSGREPAASTNPLAAAWLGITKYVEDKKNEIANLSAEAQQAYLHGGASAQQSVVEAEEKRRVEAAVAAAAAREADEAGRDTGARSNLYAANWLGNTKYGEQENEIAYMDNPEAQFAYLHGGESAQEWTDAHLGKIEKVVYLINGIDYNEGQLEDIEKLQKALVAEAEKKGERIRFVIVEEHPYDTDLEGDMKDFADNYSFADQLGKILHGTNLADNPSSNLQGTNLSETVQPVFQGWSLDLASLPGPWDAVDFLPPPLRDQANTVIENYLNVAESTLETFSENLANLTNQAINQTAHIIDATTSVAAEWINTGWNSTMRTIDAVTAVAVESSLPTQVAHLLDQGVDNLAANKGFMDLVTNVNRGIGVVQVINEFGSGGDSETKKVKQWIYDDLIQNELLNDKDTKVILLPYSGGGAIASNIVDDLENDAGVDVTGVMYMGVPATNIETVSQHAETVVDVAHQEDWVARGGLPIDIGLSLPDLSVTIDLPSFQIPYTLNEHGQPVPALAPDYDQILYPLIQLIDLPQVQYLDVDLPTINGQIEIADPHISYTPPSEPGILRSDESQQFLNHAMQNNLPDIPQTGLDDVIETANDLATLFPILTPSIQFSNGILNINLADNDPLFRDDLPNVTSVTTHDPVDPNNPFGGHATYYTSPEVVQIFSDTFFDGEP